MPNPKFVDCKATVTIEQVLDWTWPARRRRPPLRLLPDPAVRGGLTSTLDDHHPG